MLLHAPVLLRGCMFVDAVYMFFLVVSEIINMNFMCGVLKNLNLLVCSQVITDGRYIYIICNYRLNLSASARCVLLVPLVLLSLRAMR